MKPWEMVEWINEPHQGAELWAGGYSFPCELKLLRSQLPDKLVVKESPPLTLVVMSA